MCLSLFCDCSLFLPILFTFIYTQIFFSPQRQDAGLQEFCEKCSMKAIKTNFSVQMFICIILIYT